MAKKKTHVSKNTAHRRHQPSPGSSSRSLLTNPFVLIGLVAVLALVVWLVVTGTGNAGKENGLGATISVEEAYSKYQEGAFLLDVRENSEWDEFHVPGTTHIPLGELAERVDELPRDQPIVVICRSGNRSQQGRDILLEAGFSDATSMDGGLKEWLALGYPTE
jgi:rhodanese-related sulfurtransferase